MCRSQIHIVVFPGIRITDDMFRTLDQAPANQMYGSRSISTKRTIGKFTKRCRANFTLRQNLAVLCSETFFVQGFFASLAVSQQGSAVKLKSCIVLVSDFEIEVFFELTKRSRVLETVSARHAVHTLLTSEQFLKSDNVSS